MRLGGRRKSQNIEDRRGRGRASLPIGGKGAGGIGTIILVLAALYFGVDPSLLLNQAPSGATSQHSRPQPTAREEELANLVAIVLADTEDTWHQLFQQSGQRYQEPKLVMFTGQVNSACGRAQAAMGPFYCPADRKVYIDLGFYQELRSRHDAPGDFAQAYVIAHEVGHHVQTLLGISSKVHQARRQVSQVEGNKLQVQMALQADCFAGLWAAHADHKRNLVERGDIDEALNAARQIGDDTLQRKARGKVVPESFTHGSSAQRASWFERGYTSGGQLAACDTF